MLLIGFTWIFIAMIAGLLVKFVLPGNWDRHGPGAMMLASVGAFLISIVAIGIFYGAGAHDYAPPSSDEAALGIGFSILGGIIGFGAYVMDVRRQPQT